MHLIWDNPGFESPSATPPTPPSSGSSSDAAADGRCTCVTCHRRMSKKTFDRHTVCVSCRGSDCDLNHRCEECTEWPEEDILLYVKHRKTLKLKQSKPKAPAPPPSAAPSVHSPQQPPRSDIDARLDLLTSQVSALTALLNSQLAAPQASLDSAPASQAPSPARLESDARSPHPVLTAGHPQESQALGGSGPMPDEGVNIPLSQGPLASAGLGWAPLPSAVPQALLQPSHALGGVFPPPPPPTPILRSP